MSNTKNLQEEPRCEKELFIEKYFGIKLTSDTTPINTNDNVLVDLLYAWEQAQSPVQVHAENPDVTKAIADLERFSKTHRDWAEYFEKNPDAETKYVATGEWDTAEVHRQIIADYDNVIRILKAAQRSEGKTLPVTKNDEVEYDDVFTKRIINHKTRTCSECGHSLPITHFEACSNKCYLCEDPR